MYSRCVCAYSDSKMTFDLRRADLSRVRRSAACASRPRGPRRPAPRASAWRKRRPSPPDANMWAARAEGVSERGTAMKTVRTVELYALQNLPRSKLLPQARVVKVVHERRTARAY